MRLHWLKRLLPMFALAVLPALAHEDIQVTGVVTKRQNDVIELKTKAGKTLSIEVNKATKVTRGKSKADIAAVKAGMTVVIDGFGDSEEDFFVLQVTIGTESSR